MTMTGHRLRKDEKMRQVLYFAYGSNLDLDQMRSRCPTARPVARAVLARHALAFGGFSGRWGGAVANVLRASGSRVEGLLYRLDEADVRALDRFEGHPFAYQRVVKIVLDQHGRRRRALLYQQPSKGFGLRSPAPRYVAVLCRAYARLGFDLGSLATAVGVGR